MSRYILVSALIASLFIPTTTPGAAGEQQLGTLKRNQDFVGFRVVNLYSGDDNRIVGARFTHIETGAPVFLVQIEAVPQAFVWFDVPVESNKGLPHALEHLLALKGTKGRYVSLLRDMRLSRFNAATGQDYVYYGGSAPIGLDDFFEEFHAWLDALYHPDFSDLEAEREFYHFGVAADSATKRKRLIEQGTVYDEMLHYEGIDNYFFELRKLTLGENNPFGFQASGYPDEMRGVTPHDIRLFHAANYRLGPSTGFIFILDPKENVATFLKKISQEFQNFKDAYTPAARPTVGLPPKYPIHASQDLEPKIYEFPSGRESDAGQIAFGWKPANNESLVQLKMLQLLFRGLAEGEQSVLYRSLIDQRTREVDMGIRKIESEVFLGNSAAFPSEYLTVSGIPGNRISIAQIKQLRNYILSKIRQIAQYGDHSPELTALNELIAVQARSWRRSESVWAKTSPLFGSQINTDWKKQFNYLSLDPSFVVSLSGEQVWDAVLGQLESGKNIWADLVNRFHLLDTPYATASVPSPHLFEALEHNKEERATRELEKLKERYRVFDDQEALSRFEDDERKKDNEINAIEARVPRPHFTDHPPLTLDDDIHYAQYQLLGSVPVIATTFDNPPTIDIGLSFDLNGIPRKYYKYLPLLPRCFDSAGLKEGERVISSSELLSEVQNNILNLTVAYESNPVSKREDLAFRFSAVSLQELEGALNLLSRMLHSPYVDIANLDRLRELVIQRLFVDESFTKQVESRWVQNPTYSFRYENDALYWGVQSQFTQAHWDGRLKWLLHASVSETERENLARFAKQELVAFSGKSRAEIAHVLSGLGSNGLNAELVEYWERNLQSFPEGELIRGLQRLAEEVDEDLATSHTRTIAEIKELLGIVINRSALHVDLTLPSSNTNTVNKTIAAFLQSIPTHPDTALKSEQLDPSSMPAMARVEARYGLEHREFPWYLGLVVPDATTGTVVFFSDFPDYSQLDRRTLIKVLSSKLCFGSGPQSFMMKSLEAGLSYNNFGGSDRRSNLLFYVADRSPDIPSLIGLQKSVAEGITNLRDPLLVDYALRQTFSVPRSMFSFSVRGREIAHDIRDGVGPEKIRQASEAILKLRHMPSLPSELTRSGFASICGILIDKACEQEQRANRSMFFFIGTEKTLNDAAKRLPIPGILQVWPSDYWLP